LPSFHRRALEGPLDNVSCLRSITI
jgi:hypothetical protein